MKFTTITALCLLSGCHFVRSDEQPKAIRCGVEAVQKNWPKAIGPVNTCLAGTDDVSACLLSLVNPVVGITRDVIACVTRKEGAEYGTASAANPFDIRSARAVARSKEFLDRQGYTFED